MRFLVVRDLLSGLVILRPLRRCPYACVHLLIDFGVLNFFVFFLVGFVHSVVFLFRGAHCGGLSVVLQLFKKPFCFLSVTPQEPLFCVSAVVTLGEDCEGL